MSGPVLKKGVYYSLADASKDEHAPFAEGWSVSRRVVDGDGEEFVEVIAYLDTQALAQILMQNVLSLRLMEEPFREGTWYRA